MKAVGFWVLLALAPWVLGLWGDAVHDDVALAQGVRRAESVSFWAPLTYPKPSKPVANVVFSRAETLGGARAQRVTSWIFHGAATAALYALLATCLGSVNAGLASLLFAWLPVHTEALQVGWFRMDVLGTAATLWSLWFARRRSWVPTFLLASVALLSKEVFVLFTPWLLAREVGVKRSVGLCAPAALWVGLGLWWDPSAEFAYDGVVGRGLADPFPWKWLPVVWGEWSVKLATGLGLSTLAFVDRGPLAHPWALGAAGLLALALLWRASRRGPGAPWLGAALGAVIFYSLVPNRNLGAERYLYLVAALGILGGALQYQPWPRMLRVGVGLQAVLLLVPLVARLGEFQSRVSLYEAEARRHPRVPTAWSNFALALGERGELGRAERALERAVAQAPHHPRVVLTEFVLAGGASNLDRYRTLWGAKRQWLSERDRPLVQYQLGVLESQQGRCAEGQALLKEAVEASPRLATSGPVPCG